MLVFIIIFIVLLFLISFLFCSVRLYFSFSRSEGENSTEFIIKYLFINRTLAVEKKQKNEKEKNDKEDKRDLPENGIKYYLDLYKEIKDDIFGVLDYLTTKAAVFENIKIKVDFGFSNVANTGVMTGTLNGVLYSIMSYFHNKFTIKDWDISVNPDFENEKFDVVFDCIVKLKTVHIITILFKGFGIFNKMKKTKNKKGRKTNG